MRTVRAAALTVTLACLAVSVLESSAAFASAVAPALTSTGMGTAVQQAVLPRGSELIDPAGDLTEDLELAGVGSYRVSAGVVTFRPALGFTGAHGIVYRVTDASGQTSDGTYTPSVTLPAPPSAPALTTTGPYGQAEQCLVPVPEQGRAVLVDAFGQPTLAVMEAAGEFDADPYTGVVAFAPANGFAGSTTIGYRVTDAYGQSALGSCGVTVGPAPEQVTAPEPVSAPEQVSAPDQVGPPAPVAARARTRGPARRQQVAHLNVPTGNTATLVDAGVAGLHVYRPGQGSYALDPATRTITFTPSARFHGTGSVTFRITDAYGRSAENAYTPTVLVARRPHARGR